MKLVYEHNDVIQDTIERGWGMECIAIIETASMVGAGKSDVLPPRQALVCHNTLLHPLCIAPCPEILAPCAACKEAMPGA